MSLAADVDVLAPLLQVEMARLGMCFTAGSRSSKLAATRAESRSRPRVSWADVVGVDREAVEVIKEPVGEHGV